MDLKIGDNAPDFILQNQDGSEMKLNDFEKKWIILYFYPRDNTPGCTREAIGFTENLHRLKELNCEIIGVSKDSVESHKKFVEKKDLKINLLSDTEKVCINSYGVWQLKKNYGKEYYGIVRSTFLIDANKKIAHIWKNVKVNGHVEAVIKKLEEFQ